MMAKSAITELLDIWSIGASLRDIKEIENKIVELKNLCLNEELIQVALINSKRNNNGIICCPYCGSTHVKKNGHNRHRKQVYYCLEENCDCKNFTATTNSILFATKKTTSTWITFMKSFLD